HGHRVVEPPLPRDHRVRGRAARGRGGPGRAEASPGRRAGHGAGSASRLEPELRTMSPEALELRRRIFASFAATGDPPEVLHSPELRELVVGHVVVLDGGGRIRMAHPFAGHRDGACLKEGDRSWWGNCAWDALGIAAALGVRDATVTGNGITVALRGGQVIDEAVFHVSVPARRWWEDIVD